MTDLEARILSHQPTFGGRPPATPTVQINGNCYHCGKPTEFADHNSCMACLEKALTDLQGTEAFDS